MKGKPVPGDFAAVEQKTEADKNFFSFHKPAAN
jgi:hypothetical protein